MSFAGMMLVAFLIDAAVGWPDALFRRIGHPVTWIGRVISFCDETLNSGSPAERLRKGLVTIAVVLVPVVLISQAVQLLLPDSVFGMIIGGFLAWPFIARRSMEEHVSAVARPLQDDDLESARREVAKIVGRDPNLLDEAGVARAATESLAENTSDGIIAPLFFGVLAGLPGIAAYKAINTMDSMIGHKSDRYLHFGRVAARLDDVVNWIPARLTGLLFAVASGPRARKAISVILQDAHKHRSPNAGWPEAAMAGALGIRLSGPRRYAEGFVDEPWLNKDAMDPG
ncbi:MAG: adenosylcobinamide-phosphate synthase CbiB, partial [Boseongicola sp.]|nr:adenosylcobinamide-phosphate synthase CbiB [Boseongicola sp.]